MYAFAIRFVIFYLVNYKDIITAGLSTLFSYTQNPAEPVYVLEHILRSGGTTSTAFVPISTQWKQANVSSALLATLSNKPSVKFRFYFRSDATVGSSNNIYIDEINLTGTVGLNELENMIGLTIYPNPTNASAVVNFIIPGNETSKISVLDIVGRVIEESTTPAINGKNVSYTVNKNGALAKGIYIVNIDVNNQRISKKLIIE